MHFKQILVVRETHQNEKRVALTPTIVALLVNKGYRILVEAGAGSNAGFSNEEYLAVGAQLFTLTSLGFPSDTFIVRVLRPSKERELLETPSFHENTAMLGFLFPFVKDTHIQNWQKIGLTTLSFDLLKASTDDPKNAQAAMSRIAGRLAFQHALNYYQGKEAKLLIIGTGPAALSAAIEAKEKHIPVQVLGRKEMHRAALEEAGIHYSIFPDVEQQIKFIRPYLREFNLVITAARVPGQSAPLLIDEESLNCLSQGSVVVDLAVSNGGNVVGSKHDQVISLANGVSLINLSSYPKQEPRFASEAFAQCVASLLIEIMSPNEGISFKNPIVQDMWVTHRGKRHDSLYETFDESEVNRLSLKSKL